MEVVDNDNKKMRSLEELREAASKPISNDMSDNEIKEAILVKAQFIMALLLQEKMFTADVSNHDIAANTAAVAATAGIASAYTDIRPSEILSFYEMGMLLSKYAASIYKKAGGGQTPPVAKGSA